MGKIKSFFKMHQNLIYIFVIIVIGVSSRYSERNVTSVEKCYREFFTMDEFINNCLDEKTPNQRAKEFKACVVVSIKESPMDYSEHFYKETYKKCKSRETENE